MKCFIISQLVRYSPGKRKFSFTALYCTFIPTNHVPWNQQKGKQKTSMGSNNNKHWHVMNIKTLTDSKKVKLGLAASAAVAAGTRRLPETGPVAPYWPAPASRWSDVLCCLGCDASDGLTIELRQVGSGWLQLKLGPRLTLLEQKLVCMMFLSKIKSFYTRPAKSLESQNSTDCTSLLSIVIFSRLMYGLKVEGEIARWSQQEPEEGRSMANRKKLGSASVCGQCERASESYCLPG